MTVFCYAPVCVALFGPPVGYYIYTDSAERGLPRARLRGFAYGFLSLLRLMVYITQKDRAGN